MAQALPKNNSSNKPATSISSSDPPKISNMKAFIHGILIAFRFKKLSRQQQIFLISLFLLKRFNTVSQKNVDKCIFKFNYWLADNWRERLYWSNDFGFEHVQYIINKVSKKQLNKLTYVFCVYINIINTYTHTYLFLEKKQLK